jgi:hypothetical protein
MKYVSIRVQCVSLGEATAVALAAGSISVGTCLHVFSVKYTHQVVFPKGEKR